MSTGMKMLISRVLPANVMAKVDNTENGSASMMNYQRRNAIMWRDALNTKPERSARPQA